MPVYFNNCRGFDHQNLYGKRGDATAFFDLNTTGKQATMAKGLRRGEECIVAAPDKDDVVFGSFSFSYESRLPDPNKSGSAVRVFFGKPKGLIRISRARATRVQPYSIFFDVHGNFKRAPVITRTANGHAIRPTAPQGSAITFSSSVGHTLTNGGDGTFRGASSLPGTTIRSTTRAILSFTIWDILIG